MTNKTEIIFFIDWSLGQKAVPKALENLGATVEKHLDNFPSETLDIDWLGEVSKRGWIVLTKDKKIATRPLEVEAIARAEVKVFI